MFNNKIQTIMKKKVLILVMLMMTGLVKAQTLDSIAHHQCGYYGPNGGGELDNVAQMSDGNVLFLHKVGINFGGSSSADVVGNVHYKVSRHGGILLDTLFVPDDDPSSYLLAKNPNDNDNIRVGIVRDSVSGGSFFQIFPFGNDLNYDSINEVRVPLSDTFAYSPDNGYLINKQNDVVFTYYTPSGNDDWYQHFACFSLDGTLKYENVMLESSIPMGGGYLRFGIFNESPLEYFWCGRDRINTNSQFFVCYVFDSLLQYKSSFSITPINSFYNFKYIFGWDECLLSDGDDFIFGSRYQRGPTENGVCLVRYNKKNLEQKNMVLFKSYPMLNYGGACPVGLGKDSEGSIYFCYDTQNFMFTDKGQVAVVKLDADFNVQWQRFCLEPEGYSRHSSVTTVLDDGGIAVGGAYVGRPEVFFLVLSDDGWAIDESETSVRPYQFYPNPAQDELHLQYSPDIQPKQIELYDLQGRLVRSQSDGLESISLRGLGAGQYLMKVMLEDGKVFTDTVLKE
jgi:hypothetical protein